MKAYGRYGKVLYDKSKTNEIEFTDSEDDEENSSNQALSTSPKTSSLSPTKSTKRKLKNPSILEDTFLGSDNLSELKDQDSFSNTRSTLIASSPIKKSPPVKNNDARPIIKVETKAFDFLDSVKVKKRKRNYKRVFTQDNEELDVAYDTNNTSLSNLDKTICEINTFLSGLKPKQQNVLENMFDQNISKPEIEETDNKELTKKYNRKRTILLDQEKENNIESDTPSEYSSESSSEEENDLTLNKKPNKTQHFNALRIMGDSLKYKEDLDFIISASDSDNPDIFVSQLLNLILTINKDQAFGNHIVRHYSPDIWNWCFRKRQKNSNDILLLKGYLLSQLKIPNEHIPSMAILEEFINSMVKHSTIPKTLKYSNKITQLTYNEFLQKLDVKPCVFYSIKLTDFYASDIFTSYDKADLLFKMLENTPNIYLSDMFALLESVLSFEGTKASISSSDHLKFTKLLISKCEKFQTDQGLIKTIILLTNDSAIAKSIPQDENNSLFETTFNFIVEKLEESSDESIDVLILNLGLCLNIIDYCNSDLRINEKVWKQTLDLILKIKRIIQNKLVLSLFCLTFALFVRLSNTSVTRQTKRFIGNELMIFSKDAENFNSSILNKINYALEMFGV